ncbi:hypothetical protein [Streptomyces sp. NBC_01615]|uniref:hypothetical protein n=1 Tax=Streptomyces sp. NBC_01615 TaxID=2975898 RepID=UPI0038630D4A
MAGGQRPAVAVLDQREGLAVVVEVDTGRSGLLDVITDDQGPVADRNVVELVEGVDAGGDLPDRVEVPDGLLLQRGGDTVELGRGDLVALGHQGKVGDKHAGLLFDGDLSTGRMP